MIDSVDWDHWCQIPLAELWKCVALSCDFEPRLTNGLRLRQYDFDTTHTRGIERLDNQKGDKYQDRIEIACAHLKLNIFLKPFDEIIHRQPEMSLVSLPAFVQWAVSIGWEMPEDLRSIGEATATAEQTKIIEAKGIRERGVMLNINVPNLSDIPAPDWKYWIATCRVTLPQAIALSLNIDPDSVAKGRFFWTISDIDLEEIFRNRLELLERCTEPGSKWTVSSFATWAVSDAKLTPIPAELAAMAPNESAALPASTSTAEAEPAAPAESATDNRPPRTGRGKGELHDSQQNAVATEHVQKFEPLTAAKSPTGNWILQIQAEASRRWKALVKEGCSPTKNSIKGDLARWCRESKVVTDTKIYPNETYIIRHVLRKWTPPTD